MTSKSKFQCNQCNKCFNTKQHLEDHQMTELYKRGCKKVIYTCECCPEFSSRKKSNYLNHLKSKRHIDNKAKIESTSKVLKLNLIKGRSSVARKGKRWECRI